MIKKILSLVLQQFIIINLVASPIMAADNEIEAQERTLEKIDSFLKSSSPSDIPFIDYLENFTIESSQSLKKFDLSDYEGKKIYVGYGVYDEEQNFCRYVEKPNTGDIENYFEKIQSFNKKSYARSLTTMSYDSCSALAADYGGKPVSITSSAENAFIYSTYTGSSKWIGAEKESCEENYINTDGKKQEYLNWSSKTETAEDCSEGKLNVIQLETGTWNKKNKESLFHCIIEVDSEDITRPIKICAPWWKIEKEYAKEEQTSFFGVDVYKINQADIPDQITVCTKYTTESLEVVAESTSREVTCTSYYDSLIAPECLLNPEQAICYVDECDGYIKQACRKTDRVTPFKDYTKVQAEIDGATKTIKGKTGIKTNVYECPASMPSLDNCLEKSTLIVYPKECPGTQCTEYNECILNSETIAAKNTCSTAFPCEKIYPSGDSEKKFNLTTGGIELLYAYCEDGTKLEFEPNLQSKNTKKCLEYDIYEIEEEVTQRCELERVYTDHLVDTSITEIDIYMNNPSCIRMNNLVEARPTKEVKFDYINNGFAQTVIKKSYLNGDEQEDVREGSDLDSVVSAMESENIFSDENIEKATVTISPTVISACTEYTQSWYQRMDTALNIKRIVSGKEYIAAGLYMDSASASPYAKFYDVSTSATCTTLKNEIGGTSTSYNSVSEICNVNLTKESADKFSVIKGMGTLNEISDEDGTYTEYANYTFITQDSVSKNECEEMAYCLNGEYNESAFNSSASSQCQVSMGDDFVFEDPSAPELDGLGTYKDPTRDENCIPDSTDGGYISQLDGLQDIYSVQEVVDGDFGYFSNYNAHPYNNNIVKVNDLEVYPIMPIPVITDSLIYSGEFIQTSITTKEPNIQAGAIAGAAAGGVTAYIMGLTAFGPIGVAALVFFVLATMIFGKKQKLNEQKYDWIIYKLVPQERYRSNVYGYDHRTLERNEDDSIYVDPNGNLKLIYANVSGFTGTLKPGTFATTLKNLSTQKLNMLTCMGWMKTEVENIILPVEKGVVVGYPKCKKLSWSCNKTNRETFNKEKDPFFKDMTNSYIGATNGVSVIVPYLGEYELIAYDQFDNILGQMTIAEDDFRDSTADTAKFAQVSFGLAMDLADQIDEGNESNACRWDLMVEWGGGISGIYFENNQTGQSQDCQKSQDGYVKDKAAVKISVRATNTDRPHVINLAKPLPFANRVFLVTLNEKEIREYRCYSDFGDCEEDEFQ